VSTSAPSAKSAEGLAAKKAKRAEAVGTQASWTSTIKPAAGGAKESKGKGIFPYGYSFHIAKEDLGSDAFMRELRATESSVPWRSRTGERVHLYLDQFGSFRADPDTTGVVLLAVQRGAKASL